MRRLVTMNRAVKPIRIDFRSSLVRLSVFCVLMLGALGLPALGAEGCLNLAVGLDTSGSMAAEWEAVQVAYRAFIDGLKVCDRVFVFRFDQGPQALMSEPITIQGEGDKAKLMRLITGLTPIGGDTRFAPIFPFLEERWEPDRKKGTLLLFTDGVGDLMLARQAAQSLPLDAIGRAAIYVFGTVYPGPEAGVPISTPQDLEREIQQLIHMLRPPVPQGESGPAPAVEEPGESEGESTAEGEAEETTLKPEEQAIPSEPSEGPNKEGGGEEGEIVSQASESSEEGKSAADEPGDEASPPQGEGSPKAEQAPSAPEEEAKPPAPETKPEPTERAEPVAPSEPSSSPDEPEGEGHPWLQGAWGWISAHWMWVVAAGGGLGLLFAALMVLPRLLSIPEELQKLVRSPQQRDLYVEIKGNDGIPSSRHRLISNLWQEIGGRDVRIPGLKLDKPILSVMPKGRRLHIKAGTDGVEVNGRKLEEGQVIKTGLHTRVRYQDLKIRFKVGGINDGSVKRAS